MVDGLIWITFEVVYMKKHEKASAILVVDKISTCDQRYKFTLQMAFELE